MTEGHGRHRVADLNLPGASKNTLFFGDVHDFVPMDWYDTLISDIGEAHADPLEQQKYSSVKRVNFERILDGFNNPKILYKELCPWDPELPIFMEKFGLQAIPFANNTSTEIYLTNIVTGKNWKQLQTFAFDLLSKFDGRRKEDVSKVVDYQLPELGKELVFEQQPPLKDRRNPLKTPDYQFTITNLKKKFKLLPPENNYRSVREKHIVRDVGDTVSGVVKNKILWKFLAPLNSIRGFADKWSLTDTSAQGTFGVYSRKVDVTNPGITEYDPLEKDIWDMMVEKLPCKGHQLTIGEAIGRMRAKSSRGLLAKDWEDTPELCQQVLIVGKHQEWNTQLWLG